MKHSFKLIQFTLLICFLCSISTASFSQNYLNLTGGFNYGPTKQADLGFSFTKNSNSSIMKDVNHHGAFLKAGYNWGNEQLMNTNIGYCYSGLMMVLVTKMSVQHYTNFENSQWLLKPEIGFTALGIVDLSYGYQINLSNTDQFGLSGHYLGLNFHIPIHSFKKED